MAASQKSKGNISRTPRPKRAGATPFLLSRWSHGELPCADFAIPGIFPFLNSPLHHAARSVLHEPFSPQASFADTSIRVLGPPAFAGRGHFRFGRTSRGAGTLPGWLAGGPVALTDVAGPLPRVGGRPVWAIAWVSQAASPGRRWFMVQRGTKLRKKSTAVLRSERTFPWRWPQDLSCQAAMVSGFTS